MDTCILIMILNRCGSSETQNDYSSCVLYRIIEGLGHFNTGM